VNDDQPEIVSVADVCPFCRAAMTDRGEYAGIWDGSLGQGFGNWCTAKCRNCGADLIGWEYSPESAPDE
jgi:ribosomal protein L37AE/L43A